MFSPTRTAMSSSTYLIVSVARCGFNNCDRQYVDAVLEAYDEHVGGPRYACERVIRSGTLLHELDVQALSAVRASPLAFQVGKASAEKEMPELVWRAPLAFKRA